MKSPVCSWQLNDLCNYFTAARFCSGPHELGTCHISPRGRPHGRTFGGCLRRSFTGLGLTFLLSKCSRRQTKAKSKTGNTADTHNHHSASAAVELHQTQRAVHRRSLFPQWIVHNLTRIVYHHNGIIVDVEGRTLMKKIALFLCLTPVLLIDGAAAASRRSRVNGSSWRRRDEISA